MPSAAFSGLAQGLAQGMQVGLQYRGQQAQLEQRDQYLQLAQQEAQQRQAAIDRDIEQARLAAEADAESLRARFQTPGGQEVAGQMSRGTGSPDDQAARRIQETLRASMSTLGEAFPAVARVASSAMESMPLPGASRYIEQTVDRVSRMTNPAARAQFLNDINFHFGSQALQREMAQAQQSVARRIDIGGYADVQIGPDGSIGMVTDPNVKQAFDAEFQSLMELAQGATTSADIDAARGALRMLLQQEERGRMTKYERNDEMMRVHREVQTWGAAMEANAANPELANYARAKMLDALHRSERFTEAADLGVQMPPMSSPQGGGQGPPPPGGGGEPGLSDYDRELQRRGVTGLEEKAATAELRASDLKGEAEAARSFGFEPDTPSASAEDVAAAEREARVARGAVQRKAKSVKEAQATVSQVLGETIETSAQAAAATLRALKMAEGTTEPGEAMKRKPGDKAEGPLTEGQALHHALSMLVAQKKLKKGRADWLYDWDYFKTMKPRQVLETFGFKSYAELQRALDGGGE